MIRNKRLAAIAEKAVRMNLRGRVLLDGYNGKVLTDGVSFAITTRTFGDNNHFLMEIYDNTEDTTGNETGVH